MCFSTLTFVLRTIEFVPRHIGMCPSTIVLLTGVNSIGNIKFWSWDCIFVGAILQSPNFATRMVVFFVTNKGKV